MNVYYISVNQLWSRPCIPLKQFGSEEISGEMQLTLVLGVPYRHHVLRKEPVPRNVSHGFMVSSQNVPSVLMDSSHLDLSWCPFTRTYLNTCNRESAAGAGCRVTSSLMHSGLQNVVLGENNSSLLQVVERHLTRPYILSEYIPYLSFISEEPMNAWHRECQLPVRLLLPSQPSWHYVRRNITGTLNKESR